METRKLIKFGKDSFVISIPKSWIRANKLSKGSSVFLNEEEKGTIILKANPEKKPKEIKKITIDSNNKDISTLKREIIAAYLNNNNIIEIVNKNIGEIGNKIRKVLHELVALEIMGENKQKIVARDFLRLNDLSIKNAIKRVDLLIRSMIADVKNLKTNSDLQSISQRDSDIDRLYYLAYRATTEITTNPQLMKELKLTQMELLGYWRIMRELEKLSDQLKVVSPLILKLNLKEKKIVEKIIGEIEHQYHQIMKAFNTKNLKMVHTAAALKSPIIKKCEKNIYKGSNLLTRVLEIMIQTTRGIHNIPRTLINTKELFLL